MTRWLLDGVGALRGSLLLQLFVATLALGVLPFTLGLDASRAVVTYLSVQWAFRRRVGHCPRGHAVELIGAWRCPVCRLVHEGHGFAECPHCGEVPHAVNCACGLAVTSPLSGMNR